MHGHILQPWQTRRSKASQSLNQNDSEHDTSDRSKNAQQCAFYKTLYPYFMHWLSFDEAAFDHLNAYSYFNNEGERFSHDFAPLQEKAIAL